MTSEERETPDKIGGGIKKELFHVEFDYLDRFVPIYHQLMHLGSMSSEIQVIYADLSDSQEYPTQETGSYFERSGGRNEGVLENGSITDLFIVAEVLDGDTSPTFSIFFSKFVDREDGMMLGDRGVYHVWPNGIIEGMTKHGCIDADKEIIRDEAGLLVRRVDDDKVKVFYDPEEILIDPQYHRPDFIRGLSEITFEQLINQYQLLEEIKTLVAGLGADDLKLPRDY